MNRRLKGGRGMAQGGQEAGRIGGLLVFLGLAMVACAAAEVGQKPVVVEVLRVGFDRITNLPVVILSDPSEKRAIPIWIGPSEARAIEMELRGAEAPRPLTHDLLKSILNGAGVVFEKVLVSELKDNTYYARIFLTSSGNGFEVDSRPSDAIALALRFRKPILVARSLMDGDTALDLQEESRPSTVEKVRGITVQEISEGLAASLGLSSTDGVLVSDAEGGEKAPVRRGDVILAVGRDPVQGIGDFKSRLAELEGKRVRVRVRREGREQVVELPPGP